MDQDDGQEQGGGPPPFKPGEDRPLTAEEARVFLAEIEKGEIEELRQWASKAETALMVLVEENRGLREQLDQLQQLLEALLKREPTE